MKIFNIQEHPHAQCTNDILTVNPRGCKSSVGWFLCPAIGFVTILAVFDVKSETFFAKYKTKRWRKHKEEVHSE